MWILPAVIKTNWMITSTLEQITGTLRTHDMVVKELYGHGEKKCVSEYAKYCM